VVEQVGPTQVVVEKRRLSPGWRAILWIIAGVFAFSFIRNVETQPVIQPATLWVTNLVGVIAPVDFAAPHIPCWTVGTNAGCYAMREG
jgi:hypothetical protein